MNGAFQDLDEAGFVDSYIALKQHC